MSVPGQNSGLRLGAKCLHSWLGQTHHCPHLNRISLCGTNQPAACHPPVSAFFNGIGPGSLWIKVFLDSVAMSCRLASDLDVDLL